MDTTLRWSGGEIDLRQRCVRSHGQTLQPNARAFDLLVALAQARGQVVAKSALLDHVWPDQAVEESNLAVHVHALRRLLGHEAVATVPGRGYRLGLPLDGAAAPAPAPSATAAATSPDTLPPDPGADLLDRAAALQTLVSALERGERLVELVGVGGAGKSTLALAAAHRMRAGGVRLAWLELATISDEAALPGAIARSAGLALHVDDQPARSLALALRDARLRLVLDGAEHLIEAVARLCSSLLPACPGLQVLLTTQVPLPGVPTLRLPVGGLSMPADDTPLEPARACGAVALFEACGRLARRGFRVDAGNLPAVREICRRCDGLPYAIELMAANLAMFSPSALAERLRANLPLGRARNADSPPRHQSVGAAISFSHDLLQAVEQTLFRRLAIFPASFSAELAEAVCSDEQLPRHEIADRLSLLVERCLVVMEPTVPGREDRFRLLETARIRAKEELHRAREAERVAERLIVAMGNQARVVRSLTANLAAKDFRRLYGADFDNLSEALRLACRNGPTPQALELFLSGDRFFFRLDRKELALWCKTLEPALASLTPAQDAMAARFCFVAAEAFNLSNMDLLDAVRLRRQAIQAERRTGNKAALYKVLQAAAVYSDTSLEERRAYLLEAREVETPELRTSVFGIELAEASILADEGRLPEAMQLMSGLRQRAREHYPFAYIPSLVESAGIELIAGQHERARELALHAVDLARDDSAFALVAALGALFACDLLHGETEACRKTAVQWEKALVSAGWTGFLNNATMLLPHLCARERRWRDCMRLLRFARTTWERSGAHPVSRYWRHFLNHPLLDGIEEKLDASARELCTLQVRDLHPQQAFDMMLRGTNAVMPAHLVEAEALADGGLPPWPLDR